MNHFCSVFYFKKWDNVPKVFNESDAVGVAGYKQIILSKKGAKLL